MALIPTLDFQASRPLRTALSRIVRDWAPRSVTLDGQLLGRSERCRCVIVNHADTAEYIRVHAFSPSASSQSRRRLLRTESRLESSWVPQGYDVAIAAVPQAAGAVTEDGVYYGQEFVRQVIDTRGSWDDICARLHSTKRKVVRSVAATPDLAVSVSRDPADVIHFYHALHVPHIARTYGSLADIDSLADIEEVMARGGFLLRVHVGPELVSAALCLTHDSTLVIRRIGVAEGGDHLVKKGARSALYYAMLRHAHENTLTTIDRMMSIASLTDGVYDAKRAWGAAVLPDEEATLRLCFSFAGQPREVAAFLATYQPIVTWDGGLAALVGVPDAAEVDDRLRNELISRYHAPGLAHLLVFTGVDRTPVDVELPAS